MSSRSFTFTTLLAVVLASFGLIEALSVPICHTVAAPVERNLTDVRTAKIEVPAPPFGIVYATKQKDRAFIALEFVLGVLDTSTFQPKLLYNISLPQPDISQSAEGIALTNDGRYVLVTASGSFNTSVYIVDAAKAAVDNQNAVVAILNGTTNRGYGNIQVTITQDDQYAFVSEEYGDDGPGPGSLNVFKLDLPRSHRPVAGAFIGSITLGYEVVGSALSPCGRFLYVTSETKTSAYPSEGTLTVLDVEKLKTKPSSALISTVKAGCGAVRVISSKDGQTVWLTARESNHLLAFDAPKLNSNSTDALLASVQVGTSPIDLIFIKNETRILTADSNRQNYPNATAGISVVDVDAALHGEKAVLGSIPTGFFPREFALSPDARTILVSDYGTVNGNSTKMTKIQAVDVDSIP